MACSEIWKVREFIRISHTQFSLQNTAVKICFIETDQQFPLGVLVNVRKGRGEVQGYSSEGLDSQAPKENFFLPYFAQRVAGAIQREK